jgi:hypothetical protein
VCAMFHTCSSPRDKARLSSSSILARSRSEAAYRVPRWSVGRLGWLKEHQARPSDLQFPVYLPWAQGIGESTLDASQLLYLAVYLVQNLPKAFLQLRPPMVSEVAGKHPRFF